MPPPNDVTAAAPHSTLSGGAGAGAAGEPGPGPGPAPAPAPVAPGPPESGYIRGTCSPLPAATPASALLQPALVDGATRDLSAWVQSNMIFSDLYKSGKLPLSRRRQSSQALPTDSPDYDADLVSRDKLKQKDAVKKYLATKLRSDWSFTWPPPSSVTDVAPPPAESQGEEPVPGNPKDGRPGTDGDDDENSGGATKSPEDIDCDTASIYSTVSEDSEHFRARAEWLSDLSEDEQPVPPSAYRFDSPDAVGSAVQASALAKRTKRRRDIREEAAWNSGLACFNARRDAWTCAKTARVKPRPKPKSQQPASPTTPSSRRLSFWRLSHSTSPTSQSAPPMSALSPTTTQLSGDSTAVASSSSDADSKDLSPPAHTDSSLYPVETLLPVPPPLLPPANPMRASITPAAYPSIYDRIVVHSMTPACPVNLGDVLRACVAGWKRDGEWPPRPADAPVSVVAVRRKKRDTHAGHVSASSMGRRMSLGFLGSRRESAANDAAATNGIEDDGAGAGKGIKRSLQKALGLGSERRGSAGSTHGVAS